jgi:hypothetical protein
MGPWGWQGVWFEPQELLVNKVLRVSLMLVKRRVLTAEWKVLVPAKARPYLRIRRLILRFPRFHESTNHSVGLAPCAGEGY